MNTRPASSAGLREGGALAQEAVAGMHRVGAGAARGLDQRVDAQVATRPPGAAPMRTASSACAHVRRVGVGVAEHGDRAVAERARGAHHAAGDLAAIGDQDLAQKSHRAAPTFGLRFCRNAARALDALGLPERRARERRGRFAATSRRGGVKRAMRDAGAWSARDARRARIAGCRRSPSSSAASSAASAELAGNLVHQADRERLRAAIERGPPRDRAGRLGLASSRMALDEVGRDLRRHDAERRLGQAEGDARRRRCATSATQARPKPPPITVPSSTATSASGVRRIGDAQLRRTAR